MFALGFFMFNQLHYAWWWFWVLLFTPDIGMLGYLVNPKIGAVTYNIFHHKAIAIIVYILGMNFNVEALKLIGVILFSHASLDRVLGYGLKYFDNFRHTHLGKIGSE